MAGAEDEDVGGLAHQLGGLDFGASSDDLALTDPLGLRGHGERVLQVAAEDDVLDEHGLDLDTPAGCHLLDDLRCRLRDLLAALDHVLQDAGTDDVAQSGLGTLDERLSDVGDTEGGLVWGDDLVVDDGGQVEGDVVLGHADLRGTSTIWILTSTVIRCSLSGLTLTRPGSTERSKLRRQYQYYSPSMRQLELSVTNRPNLRDETDLALVDGLEWVGAADTAGNSSAETNTFSQAVD